MEQPQSNLEIKKYRLEILKAFLSVLSPLIILFIGFNINGKLESQKAILQETSLRQQKIDLMQKIVPQIFDNDDNKSVAMMLLLKNVDTSMARNIEVILIKNYSSLKQNNDTAQSNSLLNAAKSFGGTFADTLKTINQKFHSASNLEKLGYSAIKKKDVNNAIKYFSQADQVYPEFRNSFEIKNYLSKNKIKLPDSSSNDWKEVHKNISSELNDEK